MPFAAIEIETKNGLLTGLLAAVLFCLSWWLYYRHSRHAPKPYSFLLPTFRGLAIAWVILLLAQPVFVRTSIDGLPTQLHILVDRSASMDLPNRVGGSGFNTAEKPRSQAVRELLSPTSISRSGMLEQLTQRFHVTVSAFDSSDLIQLCDLSMGDAIEGNAIESEFEIFPSGPVDDSTGPRESSLTNETDLYGAIAAAGQSNGLLVLLTDGNQNSTESSIEQLNQVRTDLNLYAVGFGPRKLEKDFELIEIATSTNTSHDSPVNGSLRIAEKFPSGTPYTITGSVDGRTVWSLDEKSISHPDRRIPFSIDLDESPESDNQNRNAIGQLKIKFEISTDRFEPFRRNNSRTVLVNRSRQKRQALLIEAFPRWESRYLKNLLERQTDWEIDFVVTGAESKAGPILSELFSKRSSQRSTQRPKSVRQYSVIILGDVSPRQIDSDLQQSIFTAVNRDGVGLILLDSRDGYIHRMPKEFNRLSPVTPKLRMPISTAEFRVRSADSSAKKINEAIARIAEAERVENLQYVRNILPKPGSETIANLVNIDTNQNLPWIVTHRIGAGRSTYFGNDESWRLRAGYEDELHSNLWLPILDFTAKPSYAIETDLLSLHVDQFQLLVNESTNAQLRLKPQLLNRFNRLESGSVRLNLTSPAGRTRTIELGQFSDLKSTGKDNRSDSAREYYQQLQFNEPGIYQLSVAIDGIPVPFDQHHLELTVDSDQQSEQRDLTCNMELLDNLTKKFDGVAVHVDEVESLLPLIEQQSRAAVVRSTTNLRASYWWFVPTILLLATEWLLRKRVGLI